MESALSKPVDRRVRKTKKLLKQGLIALLMEKDINAISINELVNRIDINRGTFYLHYRDLHDLLHQIEDEIMQELTTILNDYSAVEMKDENLLFFTDILQYIEKNADLFRLLLSQNGDMAFIRKLKKTVEENCFEHIKQIYQVDNPYHYAVFTAYSVSGCVGVIELWLQNGQKEPTSLLAKTLAHIIDRNIGYLDSLIGQ